MTKNPEVESHQESHQEHDEEWFSQRGITDERVIEALNEIPRQSFISLGDDEDGEPLPSSALPPLEVAGKLLQALQIKEGAKILEIGTDTGYLTALLANLTDEVYTVERRLPLAKLAEGRLEKLGIEGVEILYGPRLTEYALNAPYDAILLSAVAPRVPTKLKSRLAVGGRMVVPIGEGDKNPEIICIRRVDEEVFERQSLGQLRFSSKLGDILVELGVADRDDIELAALEADASGKKLGEALLQYAQIHERDLVRALAIQRGFKLAPVDTLLKISDHELAYSVPRAFLEHHQILPLVIREGRLSVATVDPDAPAIELARILDATDVDIYLVTSAEFTRIWDTILEGRKPRANREDNLKSRVEAKFERILRAATRVNAATIHIDNQPQGSRVRFRIDKELREIREFFLEPAEVAFLIEFLKMEAHLEVLEQQIPQRGRFSWVREPVTYHMNVHIMPSIMGEQLSLQLLSHGTESPTLEQVGFPEDIIETIDELFKLRRGLFLLVGPRHMGKKETLYALLRRFAANETLKVAMLEEDIICPIPNVQQSLIHPEVDFGYREAMYEFARFDVDVLGLGEIPNPQTALEALNVARRGMMMIGILHGKSAHYVLRGLREFGVPAEALANGVTGILTQRLAPKICDGCRELYKPHSIDLKALFPNGAPMGFKAYRGKGCAECSGTGINGQVPVLEVLPMNDPLRRGITGDEPEETLRRIILASGGDTISEYAVRLVREGQIPLEELANYIPLKPE